MSLTINTILSQIDIGAYALPVFQRGYVWNRDQVRKLMYSLYRGYPIGELLVWNTATDPQMARGDGSLTAGNVNLILDGQQRVTTLYGIFRGKPPAFFEGNSAAFTNLYFNVETETFEFYAPQKMYGNPTWINVTEFLKSGIGTFIEEKLATPEGAAYWSQYIQRLNVLNGIRSIDMNVETVTSEKSIDEVVEIFNNVNSGGTKLSKGDLALAKICGQWKDGRNELRKVLEKYSKAGYEFSMDWLLRCITVYLTKQPYFVHLANTPINDIQTAVPAVDKMIGSCLDQIASRLGLNNTHVMTGVFAIATMIGYVRSKGNAGVTEIEWNRLMYWYIHYFLWGRYTGSTESVLNQDLNVLKDGEGIDGLIRLLRQQRGDLRIRAEDFWGWSTGNRFYPLLYMLTRVYHARDWGTDIELNNTLLGKNSTLEVHHIFPKKHLYEAGKTRAMVNALANYAFLTKDTNDKISDQFTSDYMPKYVSNTPGAVESHWIPMNPELWKIENYEKFLEKRRELLAEAANKLLDSLNSGSLVSMTVVPATPVTPIVVNDVDEEILAVEDLVKELQLKPGTRNLEIVDADTGEIYILDLAWPNGIQEGLTPPLALLIHPDGNLQAAASKVGYQFFVDIDEFKRYIQNLYA